MRRGKRYSASSEDPHILWRSEAGLSCAFNLHFHHNPAVKTTEMSMGSGKGLATYRAEATKWLLVRAQLPR